MAVSSIVIRGYQRIYTKPELELALRTALNDRASGVIVTQVNFQDGGGSGQVIQGDPNELIEILTLAIEGYDSGSVSSPPLAGAVNFGPRRSET